MPARFAPLGSFALALSLGVALARGQPATPTTSPTTATTVPEELVDNPRYLAWSKYKPGTAVDLEMAMDLGGGAQRMTTQIAQKLLEVTPEKVVVESVARMSIPGLPNAQNQTQTHTFDARVPKSKAEKSNLPTGADGETKEIGTEKMDVAGKSYECKVSEFTGKVQGAPAQGKQWRTTEVPGGLVKLESDSGGNKMTIELKKVAVK
jgi:hypothetical protein